MSALWSKIAKAPYPNIGLQARAKRGNRTVVFDQFGSCREEIIYAIREQMQTEGYARNLGTGWRYREGLKKKAGRGLDLEVSGVKQPESTFLYAGNDGDGGGYGQDAYGDVCKRRCCMEPTLFLLDALVGPTCVLLDYDRYVGDWWRTSIDDFLPRAKRRGRWDPNVVVARWYGTSNFFLRHPSLVSIVLGIFRQAFMIVTADAENGLLKKINRKEVEDCLTSADPELALRLIAQTKPWLESSTTGTFFPFSNKNFRLLTDLHKAIYKHGYDEVFGGTLEDSWNLDELKTGIVDGAVRYFGTKGKETSDRKRVAKLAKK